ncbi:MAG TPA: cytochrome c biogenesis protein CcdA [Candidatus Binataceae bacterium]|nr:cytochrome c biogenesis protein CcdA [Candidatus Binataceae bacterium]
MNRSFKIDAVAAIATILLGIAIAPASLRAQMLPKPGDIVKISSLKIAPGLAAGGDATLTVEAEILSGWHINSDHPNSADFIPTRITITPPDNVKAGAPKYPTADQIAPAFSGGDKLSVFTGPIEFVAPLHAGPNFNPAPDDKISVTLDYQPCNDNICLPPAKVSADATLASIEPATRSAKPAAAAAGAIAGDPPANGGGGDEPPGSALADIFAAHGVLWGFLAVLLGGLALNLTPCVYPLIAVTVAYFGNQGGAPRRVVLLAAVYVLGIALTFSSLGVAVALSGGLFGAALQSPIVLAGIATMLLALAASSFGLFTIQAPRWIMRSAGAARPGYAGALGMGLGMGAVAAPCIGPIVLGLLLMVERSASPLFGFALFFTLAMGLGIPYIGLALAAGSIRRMPRSGEWLAWVEQMFGFVLIGLALYFLDPLTPNGLMVRLLPYYAIAAGLFLGFVTPAGRRWRPFLVFRIGVGLFAAGALVYMLIPGNRQAPHPLTFAPFDEAMLRQARTRGMPVVVDFSASWCIPCREMERTTFRDPNVIGAAAHFMRLRADLTANNERTGSLTNRFEIKGVPTTVFIDKHGRVRKREVGYVDAGEFLEDLHQIDVQDGRDVGSDAGSSQG